jgi:hypothetical protein
MLHLGGEDGWAGVVSEQNLQEAARKLATAERGRVIELGQVLGQVASSSA